MAGIQTLDDEKESLDTLRNRITFAFGRLKADPNAAPHVAAFDALRSAWKPLNQKEMDLEDAVTLAQAGVTYADTVLDAASRLVKSAIHKGKKVDVSLPLHKVFFGPVAPAVFDRPVLAKQLEAMGAWPALLGQATQPELQALVPVVTAAVQAGEAAEKALKDAAIARDAFRNLGERKALFDTYNGAAGTAWAGLRKFVHDHPDLGLPAAYADSFFQHGAPPRSTTPTTAAEATIEVASLEGQLAAAKKLEGELQVQEQQHADEVKKADEAIAKAEAAKKKADDDDQAARAALKEAKKLKPKKK